MNWNSLDREWQYVFNLAWEAFKQGNLPIAAAIFSKDGELISDGTNCWKSGNGLYPNKIVAHAEATCIQKIVSDEDPHTFTLYTTMEPCPMCMGTIVMGNIRKVKIASRDAWAGSVDICTKNLYIVKKKMQIEFMDDFYGNLQITLLGYIELRNYNGGKVFESFKKDYPVGAEIAEKLYLDRKLDELSQKDETAENVINMIFSYIIESKINC